MLSYVGSNRYVYGVLFFFFFQAEDGIRDVAVTGVQTCALPISLAPLLTGRSGRRFPSGFWSSPFLYCASASFWKRDRKSTRLNSSHGYISYAVFCLKKKKKNITTRDFSYS